MKIKKIILIIYILINIYIYIYILETKIIIIKKNKKKKINKILNFFFLIIKNEFTRLQINYNQF